MIGGRRHLYEIAESGIRRPREGLVRTDRLSTIYRRQITARTDRERLKRGLSLLRVLSRLCAKRTGGSETMSPVSTCERLSYPSVITFKGVRCIFAFPSSSVLCYDQQKPRRPHKKPMTCRVEDSGGQMIPELSSPRDGLRERDMLRSAVS